ncbi:MAG: sel1 repeat family protein [Alphaproteobacteria bacterium]|nr:sel1 repeat family protein [Alphaproteobacteria bacterium]
MMVTLRFAILVALAVLLNACATNVVAEKASRFDQAVAAYDSGDYAGAYRIWSDLADEDDLAAMRNAAQLLRQGKGVEKDVKKAFKLYASAAEKGLVTAMANVGDMYLAGEGVEKNPQAAAAWYSRAAAAGLSLAQVKLAEMYEQGVGVERDPARARALIERAARNGYAPAQAKLSSMGPAPATSSTPVGDEDDPYRGGGKITAEQNVPPAPSPTAGAADAGRPMPGDVVPADQIAKMPPADLAQMNAGLTAYAAQDKRLAFATWRNVAGRGTADAQLRVGLLYERGEGVGQDMIEAYRWLKLAANQGHPKAASELAFVAAQLAPAERAIAESLVRTPAPDGTKAP